MPRGKQSSEPLSDRQRRLVRNNLGLVGVHLRRHLTNLAQPRREREWEDLFQEGGIGLIKAARIYREESGIAFAAFALPRIHNAVSRALQTKFQTVRVATGSFRGRSDRCGAAETEPATPNPKQYSLIDELAREIPERHRPDPDDYQRETIGQRLRDRYERAVGQARTAICARTSIRGDRDKLVRLLAQERFLVPHDEAKRPLRQIARDTKSSYARVSQCDRQLANTIRKTLLADPEFEELRRRTKTHPLGYEGPIDKELEGELARACALEYARRFKDAGELDRAVMLHALLKVGQVGVDALMQRTFLQLPRASRERLLRDAPAGATRKHKADNHCFIPNGRPTSEINR